MAFVCLFISCFPAPLAFLHTKTPVVRDLLCSISGPLTLSPKARPGSGSGRKPRGALCSALPQNVPGRSLRCSTAPL